MIEKKTSDDIWEDCIDDKLKGKEGWVSLESLEKGFDIFEYRLSLITKDKHILECVNAFKRALELKECCGGLK